MSNQIETEESIRKDYEADLEAARNGGNYEADANRAFHLHRTRLMLFRERTDPNYKRPKEWWEK